MTDAERQIAEFAASLGFEVNEDERGICSMSDKKTGYGIDFSNYSPPEDYTEDRSVCGSLWEIAVWLKAHLEHTVSKIDATNPTLVADVIWRLHELPDLDALQQDSIRRILDGEV